MWSNLAIPFEDRPPPDRRSPADDGLPEVVLPAQFFSPGGPDASLQPERRLMLAVLEEAVVEYQRCVGARDTRGRRLFAETARWFASDDVAWAFSFVNLCQALGLEAGCVRAGLERLGRRRLAGEPAMRSPFRRMAGLRHKVGGDAG